MMERVYETVGFLIQFVAKLGVACGMFVAIQVVVLNIMPMAFWVSFKDVHISQTPEERPEVVSVRRDIFWLWDEVPVERHTELRSEGLTYCTHFTPTTVERLHENGMPRNGEFEKGNAPGSQGIARFLLPDYIGRECDLAALEGLTMELQVVYVVRTLYGISKARRFSTGKFRVTEGNFIFGRLSLSEQAPFGRPDAPAPGRLIEANVGGR